MSRTLPFLLAAIAALLCTSLPAGAQTMQLLDPSPRGDDPNWELPGFGFSVAHSNGQYRVYSTTKAQRQRWNSSATVVEDFFYASPAVCRPDNKDPKQDALDARCIDAIGLFWKPVACLDGETTCAWGGTWNAYPGEDNYATIPVSWLWPNQAHEPFGTDGYAPVINHPRINNVTLQPQRTSCANGASVCPPATGVEASCFDQNPNSWATGAANGKATEVRYSDGSSRWFMAFNKMIHIDKEHAAGGSEGADQWQVLWAYSNDGTNWSIHPQILFRDVSESNQPLSPDNCVGSGVLMTSMFVDGGYFYVTMTRLHTNEVYLLRSPVDTSRYSVPGYGTWQIVSGTDAYGRWTWSNVPLGQQNDFDALGLNVMPTSTFGGIRQSAIARVFRSGSPYGSRYVGLAGENNQLWLYTAESLATGPFVRRSQVPLNLGSGVSLGSFGLEFAFTTYSDNTPTTPRIYDNQLDLWIVTNKTVATGAPGTEEIIDRYTAKITGL